LPPEYLEQLAAQRARHRKEMEELRAKLTAEKDAAIAQLLAERTDSDAKLQAYAYYLPHMSTLILYR
jgi:ribosomal 50S subunit-associated protein YjgA (DUF615 family)